MQRDIHSFVYIAAIVFLVTGCGGVVPPADVDAGFATPEALLEHGLITDNPYDHAGTMSLLYLENDLQWQLARVEQVFEHDYLGDIVALTIVHEDGSSETIEATGNHPFWVVEGDRLAERPAVEELPDAERGLNPYGNGGRWTEARWLRLGDVFLTRTGKSATVSGLIIRTERVKVYNLHVEGLHLYAVGEHGVLVHNSGGPKPSPKFISPTNPAQMPPKTIPPGWRVRGMPPTKQYPNGYWKLEKPMSNGGWQPINPSTMRPGGRPDTHIPYPPKRAPDVPTIKP